MIRGVAFDFGYTVADMNIDWPLARVEGMLRLGERLGAFLGEGRVEAVVKRFVVLRAEQAEERERTRVEITAESTLAAALRSVGVALPAEELAACIDAFFEGEWTRYGVSDGLRECLDELRADGIKVGMVTNNTCHRLIVKALERHGIAREFDPIVSSSVVGVRKPDPAIFKFLLDAWSLASGEAVMVGDSLAHDVVGAHAAGMWAVWYSASPEPGMATSGAVPDAEISSFRDMPRVVRSLDDA